MIRAQQLVKQGGIGTSIMDGLTTAKDTVKGYIKSGVNSKAGQYVNNAIDSGAKKIGFENGAGTAKQKLMVGGGLAAAGGGAMLLRGSRGATNTPNPQDASQSGGL